MTKEQKQQVCEALSRALQAQQPLQLAGISTVQVKQIAAGHWEMIPDATWYQIARQVGFYCGDWQQADTSATMLLRILFSDAQHYAMAYGIAMNGGLGKTFSARQYARESGAFYIQASATHNRKTFITALLHTACLGARGNVPDLLRTFTGFIKDQEEPLIIIDDAQLLKDRVLHFVVQLANTLAGVCGIAIMGNDELRMRIVEGVRTNKEGYDLIYKSIGRRFITLGQTGPHDVALICHANGITDEAAIAAIATQCAGSLHGIEQLVQGALLQAAA